MRPNRDDRADGPVRERSPGRLVPSRVRRDHQSHGEVRRFGFAPNGISDDPQTATKPCAYDRLITVHESQNAFRWIQCGSSRQVRVIRYVVTPPIGELTGHRQTDPARRAGDKRARPRSVAPPVPARPPIRAGPDGGDRGRWYDRTDIGPRARQRRCPRATAIRWITVVIAVPWFGSSGLDRWCGVVARSMPGPADTHGSILTGRGRGVDAGVGVVG